MSEAPSSAAAVPAAAPAALLRERGLALAAVAACALVSLWRGQDTNWDLQNYHRYIAWAWVQGRLGLDLGAAGLQSYFNPALDLPVYGLGRVAPAWVTGLALGAWHGLIAVWTLLIAREVWPAAPGRLRLLAVAAGVLAPAFWGGLGNTMGDNAAATAVLAALWTALRWLRVGIERPRAFWGWGLATGVLAGAGVALKLTNLTAAVALGLGLLLVASSRPRAARVLLALLAGGALGFALAGGVWFFRVWQQFGNPFFPQFGHWFPSPLADPVAVVDRRFRPDGVLGFVLRPWTLVLRPSVASEFFVLPLLWPLWWLAGAAYGWRRWVQRRPAALAFTAAQRLLLCYGLLATVAWLALFGIYRYTVPIEPLLPLSTALLLAAAGLLPRWQAGLRRYWLLAMAVTVLGGSVDWGHSGWADPAVRLEPVPALAGERPLVLVMGNGLSWVLPELPPRARHVGLATDFRFGGGYDAEVARRIGAADRHYALIGQARNWRFEVVERANAVTAALGLRRGDTGCRTLQRVIASTRPHAALQWCEGAACAARCSLQGLDADRRQVDERNQAATAAAAQELARFGLQLAAAPCVELQAGLGTLRQPLRWCALTPR